MQVTSSRVNQRNHTVSHADSGFPDSWGFTMTAEKKKAQQARCGISLLLLWSPHGVTQSAGSDRLIT